MRILVVGQGGREHALSWRLSRPEEDDAERVVICAPGSAGIAQDVEVVPVPVDDLAGLEALALEREIDLVVIGPEQPLADGLADRLRARGLAVLGPDAAAARLESSKAFAKEIMDEAGVPTAAWAAFDDAAEAKAFAARFEGRVAVKADGLAAGKGVILAHDLAEAGAAVDALMLEGQVGEAGERVVVEELLIGEEKSAIALCDGSRVLMLAASEDHKAVHEGDTGPNTGGMGAFSPVEGLDAEGLERVRLEVMQPMLEVLARRGAPFRGVLYAGLMLTADGPKVLEFNVRFGDPETQPLMRRVKGPLAPAFLAAAQGDLSGIELAWREETACCVVLCSEGYPGSYPKGRAITGLEGVPEDVKVFHAGTRSEEGVWQTAGGRVLGVTALGATIREARRRAYSAIEGVAFVGMHFRRDIGDRKGEESES
ncbi:MAG: phosphoribosylamine--glycine ligase [Deltaproteobacteria bacterium]|nr:phosphoribosylamine--glycine ligase [Deltaproteobacteria bacterium]